MEFQTGIDLKRNSKFAVTFKTTNPDGVLFYVSDKSHTDKIALFMKDGKVKPNNNKIMYTVDGRDTGQNAITSDTCCADTLKIDISRTRRRSPNLVLCFSTGN